MVEEDKEEEEVEEVTSDNKIKDHPHSSSHTVLSYTDVKINSLSNVQIQPDFLNSIEPSIYKTRQKSVLLMKSSAPLVTSISASNQLKESTHRHSKLNKSSISTQKIYSKLTDSPKKVDQPQEELEVEEVLEVPEVASVEDKEAASVEDKEEVSAVDKEVDSVPQEEAEVDSVEEEEDD